LESFKDNYGDCLAAKFITDQVPKNQEVVEKELRLLAEQSFSVTRPLVRQSINIGSSLSFVLMLIRPAIEPLMKSLSSLVVPP
jgi:hypothetical protein